LVNKSKSSRLVGLEKVYSKSTLGPMLCALWSVAYIDIPTAPFIC